MNKHLQAFSILFFTLLLQSTLHAQIGTWTKVATNSPHNNMGVMLLLTDGTVICHNTHGGGEGTGWDKLTPDASGSYVNGTWSSIASMNEDRLFFSSQVLPSGKVYAAGGEYGGGTSSGEVYDPAANTWTVCGSIPNGWQIYDGNSEILYNGNVLEGPQIGAQASYNILQWSPITLNYTTEANAPLNHDEAAWISLPDSSILYIGINSQNSCRFIPQTNTWVTDATVPNNIYDQWGEESGCALMLPNGKAIFFGSSQYNVIYTPSGNASPGTWAAAANFPSINGAVVGQVDAPGAMMVNGHILLAVSPGNTGPNDQFRNPVYFLEYDYIRDTFTQVTSIIPTLGADSIAGVTCNFANFLDLPDGTVLMGIDQESISKEYWVYTPGSGPIPQGKPSINSILPDGCPNYKITGKLFNGISEGAAFGDDWQESTNYPLVRLTDSTHVYYAKTTNWNRIGAVQTDSVEDTAEFTLPAGLTPGKTYSLVVVANGFASNPTLFTTIGITVASHTNSSCSGNTGSIIANAAIGGNSPYTYSWAPSGGTNISATGLSAGLYTITATDNNGCTATAGATITQSTVLSISFNKIDIKCNGASNGSLSAITSGGAAPYTYSWIGGGNSASKSGLSAGSYTLVVNDNNGCIGSATVTVTQPSAMSVVVDSVNVDSAGGICNGSASVIVSGGISPYRYNWNQGSGTNDTINGKCPGQYCCQITDNNGCSTTSCVNIENVTGVQNISNAPNISIYPNPNTGLFTITGVIQEQMIELYNALGQKTATSYQLSANSPMYFNISTQADGLYLIRILNKDGSLVTQKKIMKTE